MTGEEALEKWLRRYCIGKKRKERKLICKMCGNEFVSDAPNRKYCCALCMYAAKKYNRMKFLKKHPHYNRDYKRKRKYEKGYKDGIDRTV